MVGNLLVDGEVETAPQARWWSVVPFNARLLHSCAIFDDLLAQGFRCGGPFEPPDGAGSAYHTVHLPHGAKVTGVSAVIRDASPTADLTFRLLRQHQVTRSIAVMVEETTAGAPDDYRRWPDGVLPHTIVGPFVDNRNHHYLFEFEWPGAADQTGAYVSALRIEYEVTSPAP